MTSITEHLTEIRERIASAAREAGHDDREITLLAVSKGHSSEAIAAARDAGLESFGESYLQEALPKIITAGKGLTWHFIGRLQTNKTRPVAERFDWVQTVTSARLARRLSVQRPWHAPPLQVCIQLRPLSAPDRAGVPRQALEALAAEVHSLRGLVLRGLMFMPPPDATAEQLAMELTHARDTFIAMQTAGLPVDTLSMGMSADLEVAIRYGSTMVRVGTALFGPRAPVGN